MDEDELLDLVDENDSIIGTIYRKDAASSNHKGYLRASELLILNNKGQLWIPRRQMHKKIAPGGLDFSAAGHVISGEKYEETLEREVREELNLELDKSQLTFLHKFSPRPDLPPYFRAVYIYKTNDVPLYNREDFSDYYWYSPQQLLDKLNAGESAKESLKETALFLVERNSL